MTGEEQDGDETVPEALRRLARRIRSYPEGEFPPSPPPALLFQLTDELLVVASDVVLSVGAEGSSALKHNAVLRLLAWTVADARGARKLLSMGDALTVGKRLDRQARSVRAQRLEIVEGAAHARATAREATEAGALPTTFGGFRSVAAGRGRRRYRARPSG